MAVEGLQMAKQRIPLVRRVSVLTEMKRIRKQVKPDDRFYFDMAMDLAKHAVKRRRRSPASGRT